MTRDMEMGRTVACNSKQRRHSAIDISYRTLIRAGRASMATVAAVGTPSGVSRACNTARPRQQLNSVAVQHAACSRVQRRSQRAAVAAAAAASPAANGAAATNGSGASSSNGGRTAPSSAETARTIVDLVAHGTLCTVGEEGVPLGTYVSYVLDAEVRVAFLREQSLLF